jgi:hypothetical protein
MKPPPDDDPTAEEEVLEFDGTSTDQLGDRYRVVVATASEAGPTKVQRAVATAACEPADILAVPPNKIQGT